MPIRYESVETNIQALGQPLKFAFSGRVAKNRFLKTAMAETLASWDPADPETQGAPNEQHINLYRRWGENDWGMIITGQLDVDSDLYNLGTLMIGPRHMPSGPRFEMFKRLAEAGTANDTLFLAQLVHAGRNIDVRVSQETIAASALQLEPRLGMSFAKPREATKSDIQRVIDCFVHAALYVEAAGFSGVQLHGAHGFLLSSFLSRTTNHRTDEYGGSLENRMRLILETGAAIKREVGPNFILGIKVNSVEFQEDGFTAEEAKILSRTLEDRGFDFIELTGGTFEDLGFVGKESSQKREGFFLEFARAVVPALAKSRSYVTGGFRTAGKMVEALGALDGIGLGRPAAQEPNLPKDILSGKITAAIKPSDLYTRNYHVTLAAAGAQLGQVSRNLEPIDLSDALSAESVSAQLVAWTKLQVQDRPQGGWPSLRPELG